MWNWVGIIFRSKRDETLLSFETQSGSHCFGSRSRVLQQCPTMQNVFAKIPSFLKFDLPTPSSPRVSNPKVAVCGILTPKSTVSIPLPPIQFTKRLKRLSYVETAPQIPVEPTMVKMPVISPRQYSLWPFFRREKALHRSSTGDATQPELHHYMTHYANTVNMEISRYINTVAYPIRPFWNQLACE